MSWFIIRNIYREEKKKIEENLTRTIFSPSHDVLLLLPPYYYIVSSYNVKLSRLISNVLHYKVK